MQNVQSSTKQSSAPAETTHVQGRIKREMLQKVEFPDGCTINTSIIEVQPGTCADRHTHPGVEVGYVLGGRFDLVIEGRPDQPLTVGGSYAVPAGLVHYARVLSDEPLRVFCVFITERGEPIATVKGPAAN